MTQHNSLTPLFPYTTLFRSNGLHDPPWRVGTVQLLGAEQAGTIMRTLSFEQSVAMIPDGASLMIGGFLAVGTPERVIDELVRQDRKSTRLNSSHGYISYAVF